MDIKKIREDFPILQGKEEGEAPIYFDNACMTLKPEPVIKAIVDYYRNYPGCGGRSIHRIASEVTAKYENAREEVASFLNAGLPEEIVFTKNTTEGINLVANSLNFEKGDIVLTTDREHNSNLVPWHIAVKRKGIMHKVVPSNEDNTFNLEKFKEMMSKRVRLVSMVHTSNLDGYTIPAKEIIEVTHDYGALVLLDGAQSAAHRKVDLRALDVDFFACSVHKMMGPTGMGILYGKEHLLESLDAFIVGGDTVSSTYYDRSYFLNAPEKFEAGLQNYAGVAGTEAAVKYLKNIGPEEVHRHEVELNTYLTKEMKEIEKVKIIGPEEPKERGGITSFVVEGVDAHDIALVMDEIANVMMRSGMHCVHSWFHAKRIKGSARVSFYIYNTKREVDIFLEHFKNYVEKFG
ncbi:MAG TPA: aminotransferase class V-fold PLP-dependent enzyme [Thermoplasmata archaeon]|nr:aminotransferase class V-fold PLP-dependent enzyme [Thermoplasmata archaeon]